MKSKDRANMPADGRCPVRLRPGGSGLDQPRPSVQDRTSRKRASREAETKRTLVALLLVMTPLSWSASAQQAGPPNIDHLIITDKPAVDEWSRVTQGQQPLDPSTPLETQFLLSLTPTERLGAFRFKQRCIVCHGQQMSLQPNTWGPILTKKNVEGREDAVRRQIMEGSARMPAFKYALQPSEVDAMIQYLKKVDTMPM